MSKKGKLLSTRLISHSTRMRPSKDKFYQVNVLELHSVIATILKEFWVEFTARDLHDLCLVCKDFCIIGPQDYKVADGGFLSALQAVV